MAVIMTNKQFIDRLMQIINSKSLYCKGGIGQPLYPANQTRLINQYEYNKNRSAIIKACDKNTFAVDCVGMVKTVLWGWNGNTGSSYGGAKYKSNGVPDVTEGGMLELCNEISTDFSDIQVGEFVWLQGHCGVYIGNNMVAESTPKWKNGAQLSGINGKPVEGRIRTWKKHGKLPWISYSEEVAPVQPKKNIDEVALLVCRGKYGNNPERKKKLQEEGYTATEITAIQKKVNELAAANTTTPKETKIIYTVVAGDNLTAIARRCGTTVLAILKLNPDIKNQNKIYIGQKIRVK